MKAKILLTAFGILLVQLFCKAQNVGIGTTTPVAGLHILSNNGIIAKGDTLSNNSYMLTETGAGAKIIWHPKKAAFIAGHLDNFGDVPHRWDEDSIGFGAMNLGYANKVKGYYSFATGIGNIVSGGGFGSVAMGHNSFADSNECVAIGFGAEARQRQAIAIGTGVVANGRSSFATGYISIASGYTSTVGGFRSSAIGDYSFSNGYFAEAKGMHSFSQGYGNYSGADHSFTAGIQDSVFEFTSPYGGGRSAVAFGWGNKIRGAFAISAGTFNQVDSAGYNSAAIGYQNRTGGNEAMALGGSNQAMGIRSVALGSGNSAFGNYSVAIGKNASTGAGGNNTIVMGNDVQAFCSDCIVMGSTASNTVNIGIGNSNPIHAKLEVNESIGDAVAIFGANKFGTTIKANYPGVGFNFFYNGGSYTLKAGYAGLMEMNTNTGDIYFGGFNFNQSVTDFGPITGYKQILTMKQSGNVGIGVDNPVAQLDVQKSNIGAIALVNFKGTSNYSHFMYGANEDTYIRGGKNGSNVIINDITAGKTGVSTSTPLTTFHVKMLYTVSPDGLMLERDVNNKWITGVDFANDYSFYIFNGATYPYRGYIDHVSGTYNSLSDKNLKTDIQPLDNNFGLSMLMQLNPVRYHFLDGNRQKFDYGFISQEVEKVNPDFVTNKDGVKMLGYTEFIPVTVKAVQEQQQQIEELRKEVETLKKLILSKN